MRLQEIGSFDEPLYVTAPPGDERRVFVVEQGGTIRVVRGGEKLDTPFLDLGDRVQSGGEQGLLSMAFAPDYATSGLFYVYYTDSDGDQRVVEYKRRSEDRGRPGVRAPGHADAPTASPTTTAACCSSARTGCSTSGSATAAAAGDQHGVARQRPVAGHAAGQDPAHRPARERRRARTRSRATTRSSAAPARKRRDLQLRPAQPVALLVRSLDRRPDDRRRRPERGRGDLLRAQGQGPRARTSAGARSRATTASRPASARPAAIKPVITERHSDGNCSITGGVVIRDPALTAWRGRYVFGDFCRGVICRPRSCRPAARAA